MVLDCYITCKVFSKQNKTFVTQPVLYFTGNKTLEPTTSVPVRRVSWVPPVTPTSPASSSDTHKKKRSTVGKSAPSIISRQRSFSLESNSDVLRPSTGGSWQQERRSVSLKSSPLISARQPPPEEVPCAKAPPERSIIAELRRSSEIFKSILLNLSMRETDQADSDDKATGTEESPKVPQVDVATLLAEHERRRLASFETEGFSSLSSSSTSSSSSSSGSPSRCSVSSLSSPEEEDDIECTGDELLSPSRPLLKVNPTLPEEKLTGIAGVYTRQYLFTLPALFLAVVKGNATLVYLLLKYGASVNFQVSVLFYY